MHLRAPLILAVLGSIQSDAVVAVTAAKGTSSLLSSLLNTKQQGNHRGPEDQSVIDRLPNEHHAGYIVHGFTPDDYTASDDLLRNITARYHVTSITTEPDQYVHAQISMHQQIQLGGDSGVGANCDDHFLTLGTQTILTYSGQVAHRPYYFWSGMEDKVYLPESFGTIESGDEIWSWIAIKDTESATVYYENISKGNIFMDALTGESICAYHTAGSWSVGYEPEETTPSGSEPLPGFDARIFWDIDVYSNHMSETQLPYLEPMDLIRKNAALGEAGAANGTPVQFATSYYPYPEDDENFAFGVYWNLIPSWAESEFEDHGHN